MALKSLDIGICIDCSLKHRLTIGLLGSGIVLEICWVCGWIALESGLAGIINLRCENKTGNQ